MDVKTAAPVHHTATENGSWDGPAAEAAMPNDEATLKFCHAWWDSNGDLTKKSSYKDPHHRTKGGPANLAACRNGLARLANTNIPESDKAGVRAHLQAHLDDSKKVAGNPVNTKSLTGIEIKDADLGQVTAVFSTLGQIDSDGDVTLPGAFSENAPVVISSYGHTSWNGMLPVGKGTIHTVGDQAILDGQFFMNTQAGKDTFEVIKALGDRQEFSYGYEPTEFSYGEQDGQKVRFLKQLQVFEVSPVLRGAGVGTRLLTAKSADAPMAPAEMTATAPSAVAPAPDVPRKSAVIAPHVTPVVADSWDAASLKTVPDNGRPSELRSVFAWCDSDADPELKASYTLGHHNGVNGPANQRAVLMAIAELNAPDGLAMSTEARKAAYDHLAAHLRDADMDAPELRDGPVSALKFFDHGAAVLASVTGFTNRAQEVMALRSAKGKQLSANSTELIRWIDDELTRLKSLLVPQEPQPIEDATNERLLRDDEFSTLMAAVAAVQGL